MDLIQGLKQLKELRGWGSNNICKYSYKLLKHHYTKQSTPNHSKLQIFNIKMSVWGRKSSLLKKLIYLCRSP